MTQPRPLESPPRFLNNPTLNLRLKDHYTALAVTSDGDGIVGQIHCCFLRERPRLQSLTVPSWWPLVVFVRWAPRAGAGAWHPPSVSPPTGSGAWAGWAADWALRSARSGGAGVSLLPVCVSCSQCFIVELSGKEREKNRRGRKKTTTITASTASPPPFPSPPPPPVFLFSHPHSFPPLHGYYHSFSLSSPLLSGSVWTPNIVLFMPPTGSPPSLAQRLLSPPWNGLFGSCPQCMRCAQTQESPHRQPSSHQNHTLTEPQPPPPSPHN